jgi:hypothetical protein
VIGRYAVFLRAGAELKAFTVFLEGLAEES